MKQLIQRVIQLRNPDFKFDPDISSRMIRNLMWEKGLAVFRVLFKKPAYLTSNLLLGRGVVFHNKSNIILGKWVKIDDYTTLNALGRGPLTIGNNSSIGAFSRVIISTSFNNIGEFISIGDNVGIGEYAYLGGGGGLEIGSNCIVGQYLSCHPENHNFSDNELQIRHQGVSRQGIKIGNNCWIGSKVTVTDGVTIGDNCVIAAGAVVTRSMPADSVIGGVPAKVLKKR